MAVAVTAMQLENDLKLVEDDLGSFIESQKNRLLKDKLHLKRNIPSSRRTTGVESDGLPSPTKQKEKANGLNLGGYESKQQKLRDERQKEYKQYLEQQAGRGKKITNDTESQNVGNKIAKRYENRKEYKANIDKEYGNLVKSKKNEESLYNLHYGVEDDIADIQKSGKKIIEFDESEDELFNYVLKEKTKNKKGRRSTSGSRMYHKNNEGHEDGRSSSVPPPKVPYIFGGSSHNTMRKERDIEHKEALEDQIKEKQLKSGITSNTGLLHHSPSQVPYIFGGSSHSVMRKEKNIEYKQALEEQIKEKEAVKMREKLKRMGKLTSSMDVGENLSKKDEISQYSEQIIARTDKTEDVPHSGNVENVAVPYPIQNNYPINPMYNPMMNYPMGWPAYGAMVPNGFVHNNMMGLQQMPTDMQRLNMSTHNKDYEKTVGRYVPSAIDKSINPMNISQQMQRINMDTYGKNHEQINGSTKRHPGFAANIGIGGVPQELDMSVKRAQQIAYQQELKQQMEIKKAAAQKDKQEREKYEMKLEKEIATYDPWGKSGCGAPVRNKDGNIVADLKKILQDKEAVSTIDGNTIQDKLPEDLSPLLRALELSQKTPELTDDQGDIQKDETSPSYARGAALKELQGLTMKSPRDKKEQTSYKQFLQQQVDEKKRKEEELKEAARLEEEKENKRLIEQQQRMREEYEKEKDKQRKKAEELRQQNEALCRIAEQKKLEEENKRKQIEDEKDTDRRREAEMKYARNKINEIESPPKSSSPPVPAVTKTKRTSVRGHKEAEVCTENETMEYLNTIRNSLNKNRGEEFKKNKDDMQEQKHLIHQLSTLRKQLMRQELKVQTDLKKNQQKYSNLVSHPENDDQPKVHKKSAFDRATSITSGKKRHPMKVLTEYQLDNDYDNAQRDLDAQQQEYMRQQEIRFLALRQGVQSKTLPTDFRINRQASKQSLLESDSKFISIDNHREVKNLKPIVVHKKQGIDGDNPSVNVVDNVTDTDSISTLRVEDIARRNDERLTNLKVEDIAHKTKERLNKLEQDNVIQEFMVDKTYDAT